MARRCGSPSRSPARDAPPLVDPAVGRAGARADAIVLELRPPERTSPVLGRVVSLVAARADFSIDRLSDAQIVSDAIAGAAGAHLLDGTLSVAIDEHEHGFDLLVGPFAAGGAQRLVRRHGAAGARLAARAADRHARRSSGADVRTASGCALRLLTRD